jgi:hypothetical protein
MLGYICGLWVVGRVRAKLGLGLGLSLVHE